MPLNRPLPVWRGAFAPLSLLLFFLLAGPVFADEAPESLVKRADAMIEGGNATGAIPLLQSAVETEPANADAHFLLGVALAKVDRGEAARTAFRRTVALEPTHWRAHYNLGAGYFQDGMWEQAANAFLAIPRLAPDRAAPAYLNAGLARFKQGRKNEGRELLERAIAAEPEGASAGTARDMLARLDRPAPAQAAEVTPEPAPVADSPRTAKAVVKAWKAKVGVGREYDSNVFLAPDDQTAQGVTDWRNILTLGLDHRGMMGGYRVTSEYDFYGRWYDTETNVDYHVHRLRFRAEDRGMPLSPRLGYTLSLGSLGGTSYLNTHQLDGRLTLSRSKDRALWGGAHVRLFDAAGASYRHLAGTEWQVIGSGAMPVMAEGRLFASVALRYLDRDDLNGANGFRSYSYLVVEPFVRVTHPIPGGWEFSGSLRVQFRNYADDDTWTTPAVGAKQRADQRVTLLAKVSRPVYENVDVELSWRAQVNRSNIGEDVTDYENRDYTRNVVGAKLVAGF